MRFAQKFVASIAGLAFAAWATVAQAQVPHIIGTWELNADASQMSGPGVQSDIRSYRLTDDGVLIGLAIIVGANGEPFFLQFAAKPDGGDYPEFDAGTAAQYLIDGTAPARTYAEIPTDDPRRVRWIDKANGEIIAQGEKWVSEDGQTLTVAVDEEDENGQAVRTLFVYDRTGP